MNKNIDCKTNIICLTPIKNEAWILDLFLKSASLWADHIIVADQISDDGSREIALKYPKVTLIENNCKSFNERERQAMLIAAARKIFGKKIFVALDADEILTPDALSKDNWETIKNLKEGTVIKFEWLNIRPNKGYFWIAKERMPFGFVDDGSDHVGAKIHSPRVPVNEKSALFFPKEMKVLHFQYADWERMESKHRWYQCWEKINNPQKSCIEIYRQYHHMYSIRKNELKDIPENWRAEYMKHGIDMDSYVVESEYRWDKNVFDLLQEYPRDFFNRIDIWKKNWEDFGEINVNNDLAKLKDNRRYFDIVILKYLDATQKYHPNIIILVIDKILKYFIK